MITSFKKTSKLKNKKKRSKLQDHRYTSIWTNDGYPNYEVIVIPAFEQMMVIQIRDHRYINRWTNRGYPNKRPSL